MNCLTVLALLISFSICADPTDTVKGKSEFFNWIADTMYSMINLAPRLPQKVDVQGTEVKIESFTSVAVGWLSNDDSTTSDLAKLIGKYAISIIVVTALSGLVFVVILGILIWWCLKQCLGSKQNPRKEPSPCTSCRSKYNPKARCGCRICYTIIALFVLFGVLVVAIGGILLNVGVKDVFDKTVPIFSNVMDIANNLLEPDPETYPGALDAGDGVLRVTTGFPNFVSESGYMNTLMTALDQLKYWINIHNSLAALSGSDKFTPEAPTDDSLSTNPPDILQYNSIDWSTMETLIDAEFSSCTTTTAVYATCTTAYRHLQYYLTHDIQPYYHTLTNAYTYISGTNKDVTTASSPFDTLEATINEARTNFSRDILELGDDVLKSSDLHTFITTLKTNLGTPGTSDPSALLDIITGVQELIDWLRACESPFGHTVDELEPSVSTLDSTTSYKSTIDNCLETTLKDKAVTTPYPTSPISAIEASAYFSGFTNAIESLTTGQDKLDDMSRKVDDVFYNVSVTIAKANRFLSIYVGFVDDYKALYTSYGDIIVYVVAGLFIAFGVLVILTVFCTYFCSKDTLFCCAICCDQIFFLIIGVTMIILAMMSWGLMDIYQDLYKSDKVTKFNDLFAKILRLTYWDPEPEEGAVASIPSAFRLLPNDDYVAPKIQELLPFESLDAGQLGYWFLKKDSSATNTLLNDFLIPMNSSLTNIIEQTNKTSTVYGSTTFRAQATTALSGISQDSCTTLDYFVSNITDRTLERTTIHDMLYTVLDPVFLSVAHSTSVMWAGCVILLSFSIPAELILMCGRTLWQPVARQKSERYAKQKRPTTVRKPPSTKSSSSDKKKTEAFEPSVQEQSHHRSSSRGSSHSSGHHSRSSSRSSSHHHSSSSSHHHRHHSRH